MLRARLTRRGIGVTPVALAAAMSGIADARAAVPQALYDATVAAAFGSAAAEAGVALLTAGVLRGLATSTAIKGSAVVLALVSIISAAAGFATLAGLNRALPAKRSRRQRGHSRASPASVAPTCSQANGEPAWAW